MIQTTSIELTNKVIKDFNDGIYRLKRLSQKEREKYVKKYEDQVKYEDRFLSNSRICHTDGKESVLGISISDLTGIKLDTILKKLKYNFYDYTMMEEIRCMINTIIDIKDGDTDSERARIHHFLESLKRFGTPSAYNFALKGDIKSNNTIKHDKPYHQFDGSMVVVKCPREPSNAKELIHELVVGVGALNELRKYIPNFSMVYDAYYCSAPVVDDTNKEVISWCMNSDNPVSYVIYENVTNPIPFKDLAKDKTSECSKTFLMYIAQVALAEYLAEEMCGFAHLDSHNENWLLRDFVDGTKIPGGFFYIPYYFRDSLYYIPSPGRIATAIDYGMSRVVLKDGTKVGKLDSSGFFPSIGIETEEATAIADIHKLLCFMLRDSVLEKNVDLTKTIGMLIGGYFYDNVDITDDELLYILEKQWDTRYHINAKTVKEREWTMDGFIVYLDAFSRGVYGTTLFYGKVPEGSLIMGTFQANSISPEVTKKELGIEISGIPTLFDLSQNPSNETLKKAALSNIMKIVNDERNTIRTILNESHNAYYVLGRTRKDIEDSLDIATHSANDLAKIVDGYYNLKEKLKEVSIVLSTIKSKSLNVLREEIETKLSSDTEYINKIKDTVISNYESIQMVIFGEIKPDVLSESDMENYSKDTLFNLYDKYNKIVTSLRKLGF